MFYIPKKIHLIWVGRNPYSEIVKKCIRSWEQYCPDYEIVLWNEDSFDINSNAYVKEAYEAKKWAFVSDYIRLYALYTQGGIYIDSDVELLQPIDSIIENEHAVTGYSASNWIPTGLMATEKGNIWVKKLLEYYNNRHFILPDGSFDMKVNNVTITEISKESFNFKVGDYYIKEGNVRLYPQEYFHPYPKRVVDWTKDDINQVAKYYKTTKNTYCIHYGTATWVSDRNTFIYKIKHLIRRLLPQFIMEPVERIYYNLHSWSSKK